MRGLIIDFTTFLQEIDYARCSLVRWFPAQGWCGGLADGGFMDEHESES